MFRFLAKIFVIAAILAAAWLAFGWLAPAGSTEEKLVQLKTGSSAHRIAAALQTAGVIHSQSMFLLWHSLHGRKPLKAGEYVFDHPARLSEVYDRITRGDIYVRTLVIPEGYNMFDIAAAIESAGLGKRDDFLQVARTEAALVLPSGPTATTVAELLRGAGCRVDTDPDFITAAWRKLLTNALAGFLALSRRRSGMFRRDDVAELSRRYVAECLAVARAEGARLPDDAVDELVELFRRAPEDMGTSILADAENRRRMEWDIRNGVIIRKGRAHGLPTPISDVLVPLLAAASDGPG